MFCKLSVFLTCLLTFQIVNTSDKQSSHASNVAQTIDKSIDLPNEPKVTTLENVGDNDSANKVNAHAKKHIVMFHPWGTRSHMNQFGPLITGLLEDGNSITSVFTISTNIVHDDYTEIIVEDSFSDLIDDFTKLFIADERAGIMDWIGFIPAMQAKMNASIAHMFETHYKQVIESVQSRGMKVDSLILTGTFPYNGIYLGHIFQCPIILFSNIGFGMHMTSLVGNPENPSYQNEISMPFIHPMTFKQRLLNTFLYYMEEYYPSENRFVLSLLKEKANISFEDVQNVYSRISLVLQVSHHITHNAQALSPNVIDVGGIHCKPAKALPPDLKKFMDDHKEGVVYVSFGSAVKPADMSLKRKEAFLEVFRKLKYQVLWKWNEDHIPGLPSNVKLTKWVPQQDLLGHPNLKLFVTHGGLLSLQEAIYHNTPLVGVPLGNDQVPNILRAEQRGYAVMLDWPDFTAERLYKAIDKAIHDPNIKANMNKMHQIMRDEKESPVDRAVFWIGYIMRHDGAYFLRPQSVDLYWYEYHHIDVILLIFILLILLVAVNIKIILCCYRLCCKRTRKNKTE